MPHARMQAIAAQVAAALIAGVPACTCEDPLGHLRSKIVVEPASLDFGRVALDSTKELELTIRNEGTFLLRVEGFSAEPPFIEPSGTATIATGAALARRVGFRPAALGAHSSVLTLRTDEEGSPVIEVPLSGIGIAAAVKVDPASIDFGDVLFTSGAGPMKATITVSNPGSDAFDLTEIALPEDGGGAFDAEPGETERTYAPGDTAMFDVTFTPSTRGTATGAVRIRTTARDAPEIAVPLRAKAVGPEIEICASADGAPELCTTNGDRPKVDFIVDRNGTGHGTIRVLNAGDRSLSVSDLLVTGAATEFAFSPGPGASRATIAPGMESLWEVTYTPQDYAFDSIIASFVSDAGSRGVESVRVEGRIRAPDLEIVPRAMTFHHSGAVFQGATPVRIYNCGTAPLVLGAVTIRQLSGPAPALSLQNVPAGGTTIAPGTCTGGAAGAEFGVVFATMTNGTYTGTVEVRSSDPIDPTLTVDIAGTKD